MGQKPTSPASINRIKLTAASLFDWLQDQKNRLVVLLSLAAIAMFFPLIAGNYELEVVTNIWFYVILCLGLNIVVGYAGLLDLGYAAFFAVGAYTTGILTSEFGVNFWLTIPIARNLEITGGASGLIGIERPSIFGFQLTQIIHFYYVFLILAIIAGFVSYRLQHSRMGRAWQYVREDEDAAEAMGINRVAVKLYAYVIGAIFGGVAGSFFAAKMSAISPETFQFQQSVLILLGVVLGGMGKIPGVIIGAFALVLFPEVFRELGSTRILVFAIVMLIIMLYRPEGIWPAKKT